jgi:hypothetical protein
MLDIIENIALKYNWWTNKKDIKNISDYIKVSYIFSSWNIFEVVSVVKALDYKLLNKAFDYIKNDNFSLKDRRKKVLSYLLAIKKNGNI